MANSIRFKRGNAANLPHSLGAGEPAFTMDSHKLYVGTGTDKVLINPDCLPISGGVLNGSVSSDLTISAKHLKAGMDLTIAGKDAATEEFVNSKIDDLQIGGRNLLLNSNFRQGTNYWVGSNESTNEIITIPPDNSNFPIDITSCVKNTSTTAYAYFTQIRSLLLNTQYTISLWIYVPENVPENKARIAICYDRKPGWNSIASKVISERGEWVKKSITFTTNETYPDTVLSFGLGSLTDDEIGCASYSANWKLEIGNKASDWTSAPEDVQAKMDEKLNASSYSASDVLAKLKTVDGAGSGLDADLLDGHHSDYFASASHSHTLPDTGVTPGQYTRVNVDSKGRVTQGSSISAADLPTIPQALLQNISGTFIPTIACAASYTSRSGYYTKVGRLVTAFISISFTADGVNNFSITGCPFKAAYPAAAKLAQYTQSQFYGCPKAVIGEDTSQISIQIETVGSGASRYWTLNAHDDLAARTGDMFISFTLQYISE